VTLVTKWGSLQEDNGNRSGRTGIHWRPAWEWPDKTKALILELLEDAPHPILNVCSGATTLGDVTVDLHHPRADVHADARCLPLGDETVGTVLMDPPWTIQDFRERHRFVCEAGRVLDTGGLLLIYAPWMPRPTWAELEGAWVRNQTRYRLPSAPVLVTKWRKVHTRRDKHAEARTRDKTGHHDDQQRVLDLA
jgi:hypothetical protein